MIKVVCKQCGEEFKVYPYAARRPGGKFCSRKCAGLFKRKRIARICVLCGKEFEGRLYENQGKRVFCSKDCFYQWKKRHNTTHNCLWCGEEFVVVANRAKSGRGKFCSRKCLGQWSAENLSGENNSLYQQESKNCEQCGEEFRAIPSANRKFCSRKCKWEWQSQNQVGDQAANWQGGPIKLTCRQCSKEFEAKKKRAQTARFCSRECMRKYKGADCVCKWCGTEFAIPRSRKDKATFCSKECYWQWRVGNTAGEDCSNWQGGASLESYGPGFNDALKQTIRDRDKRICAICKLPEKDKRLSTHHIDYCKTNNDPLNLIALCNKCHVVTNFHRDYWRQILTPLPHLHKLVSFHIGTQLCPP